MMLKPADKTNATVQCGPAENSWSSLKGSIVAALPKQHSALAELTESFVFNELHSNHTASYRDVLDCIMDHLCGTQLCLAMVHRNEPDLNSTMELLSDCVGT